MPEFKVGEYYKGKCTGVTVVQKGDYNTLEYEFEHPNGVFVTVVFLGSDKVGKDGKTADERAKADLVLFGAEAEKLETGNIMAYIRSLLIGREIEFQAEEYRGVIQFKGCRPPGSRPEKQIVLTENPFGAKRSAASGSGVF